MNKITRKINELQRLGQEFDAQGIAVPPRSQPRPRFLGTSEVWRDNGTGTRDFYLFGFRVRRREFYHSTTWLGPSTPTTGECR